MTMRLCLPLALLSFLPTAAFSAQIPLTAQSPPLTVHHSKTLITALSADANYTRLLRLLQRTRLVPTLNRLDGSTLFAPTNDAIEQHRLWNAASAAPDDESYVPLADNIQEALRQQLFYHLLNYSVTDVPSGSQVEVLHTLHFPQEPLEQPGDDPAPNPPWMPVPGGSLGGEPQRLRWAARKNKTWVGTNYAGKRGIQVVRPMVDAGNGVLLGINGVLDPPTNLSHVISQHTSLSYFYNILPAELKDALETSSNLTLFLPENPAWDTLHPIEKMYLESNFSHDDLQLILGKHSVLNDTVLWSDRFSKSKKVTTVSGDELTISVLANETKVSSASLVHPDIYASNGVLHIVSSLLTQLQLTPEKYLLALNCTAFVSSLRSVQLSPLVNSTNASYTILAPRDDVISLGGGTLPEQGTAALARMLRYHFLPGRWTADKLRDGMLLKTALEEDGLGGDNQVLNVGVAADKDSRELTFAGASVIDKPLDLNNSIIYLISRPLIPPLDMLQMALPTLQFSTFIAAVSSTTLADKLKNTSSATLLIPQNAAFERLGLVTTHLLSSSSKSDLENVILHHVLTEVAYMDSLVNGSQKTYGTLDGSDVRVARSNQTARITPSGGWDGLEGSIVSGNVLTQTGVIHELSNVLVPRSVSITIGKLASAAKGTTMASLVMKAGMGWVLNGTAPPDGSEWSQAGLTGGGWTLLCPTDDSFKGVNMTRLWDDMEGMKNLVSQHLIPGPIVKTSTSDQDGQSSDSNQPISMDGSATYSTLLSRSSFYGDIVFQQMDSKNPQSGYLVGIKGARGTNGKEDWANVLAWGRSTTTGAGGGVVQIDRLLVPYRPAWWVEYGPPTAVGVAGVALIGAFFWGVAYFWRRESVEATYEPVGGFDREDDD